VTAKAPALLVAAAALAGCGPRVDLQREAMGIPWEKLSGRIVYARWDQPESADPRGLVFLIDVPARTLSLARDVRTVTPPPGFDTIGWVREVAFGPGAATVTFTVLNETGHWELRSLALDSGLEQVLFPNPNAHHNFPAWSPDGHLAFYENGADGAHLLVDGRFALGSANPSRVAWDGSSTFIASVADATSPGALVLADPRTQTLSPVVTGTDIFEDPALDPSRQKLAYVRRGAATYGEEIWIANVDGTGQTRATSAHADSNPSWSADGSAVLFARFGAGLFLYDVATRSTTQVTRTQADTMAWAP